MLKRLISMIVALTLSLSFVMTAASCTQDEEIPAEYLESLTGSEEETARESAEDSDKSDEEEKFMTLFEYLESVKNVSALKVLELEDTFTTLKTLVQLAYSSGMVTREFLINLAISQAKIEGVENLKDVCDKAEEEYPYATFVSAWKDAVKEVKEPIELTLEELNKYTSYEELLLAQKDTIVEETTVAAELAVVALDITGLDALKLYLNAEEMSVDDVKMLYSALLVPYAKATIRSEFASTVEEIGLDRINELSAETIGETFESAEEVFVYIDSLIDAAEPYVLQGLEYALTHSISTVITELGVEDFSAEDLASFVIDLVSDDENYASIAACLEEAAPYAELKAKFEEDAAYTVYLDLVSLFLESFEGEGNGYYKLISTVGELDKLVLTAELRDQILDVFAIIETLTVNDVIELMNQEAEG